MRRPAPAAWLLAFVIGCAPSGEGEGSSATTASETDPSETGTLGTTAASSSSGESVDSTGGPTGLTHGYVKLELLRGQSQADDPFVGTATVIAVLQYRECLGAFYDGHPELRQDGTEGAAVFGGSELGGEGWLDRLCTPMLDSQLPCTVEAIVQDVDIVDQLTVVYQVSGALEGGVLLFGPLPNEALAECVGGVLPVVAPAGSGALRGNADNGAQIWGTESYSPAEVATNQAAPLQIFAAAVGG